MTLRTSVTDLHLTIADEAVREVEAYEDAVLISARTDEQADICVMLDPRTIERAYAVLVAEGLIKGTP